MEPARPLRDVFADLVTDEDARRAHAADPDGFLQAHGHAELPGGLLSEAIANYADTAPAEVAEHLAPFVMAHSPVPVDAAVIDTGPADGLQLLATAPAEPYLDALPDGGPDGLDGDPHPAGGPEHQPEHQPGHPATDPAGAAHDPFDLDFGPGHPVEDMQHVPHPGAAADPAAGHLHEAQVDAAFTELGSGHVDVDGLAADHDPGQLDAGHQLPDHDPAGAHGWLGAALDADADHGLAGDGLAGDGLADGVGDDGLGAGAGEFADAGHNLADLRHDLDAHRGLLDAGHDTPDQDLTDL